MVDLEDWELVGDLKMEGGGTNFVVGFKVVSLLDTIVTSGQL